MSRTALGVIGLVTLLAFPLQGQEQAEEPARGLFISQWQCPQSEIQEITQLYDSIMNPIEQQLVDEGLLYGAGMFLHDWADEWNVNWYRTGQDRSAVFAAIDEFGNRMNAQHPDAPDLFASCTAHRDNIYFWGPRTDPPPQQ